MYISQIIEQDLFYLRDDTQARILSRFFKTGKGQYGEGDQFLGVRVPQTRSVIKLYVSHATLADVDRLTQSPYHEIRLAGFLLLVACARSPKVNARRVLPDDNAIISFYLSILRRGNNWDMVDLVAPELLGRHIVEHPEEIDTLYRLAASSNLWERRAGIVAHLPLVREHRSQSLIEICDRLLASPQHNLIQKAIGWLLREAGKHDDERLLLDFLDRHASTMPRIALRYSVERLSPDLRKHYLGLKK